MKRSTKEEKLQSIIQSEKFLNQTQDLDVLLETLLTEARTIVNADAGSIYVVEDDKLRIKYAQNNTELKKLSAGEKLPFVSFSFPMNEYSIAGYVASKKEMLNIADVYNIAADSTFKFNTQPDKDTGYRTKSMLTIPLVAASGKTLGVLQIINAQDQNANTIAFDENAELYLNHFAANATIALERASLTRAMILRTIKMAEFRDPKETGAHVNRVASFAVELYDRWAFEKEVPFEIQHKYRDTLRIAAMLHDVGKVGISDSILKKPARFTPEEHDIIKGHAVIGAALFNDIDTDIENMARDVALRHHERWDGTGYPGKIPPEVLENPFTPYQIRQGLSGEEIPLSARIVALADVFDALSSKRVYKDSWKEEDVYEEIRKSSGTHFDPDLVTMFFAILPRIKEIQAMWPD